MKTICCKNQVLCGLGLLFFWCSPLGCSSPSLVIHLDIPPEYTKAPGENCQENCEQQFSTCINNRPEGKEECYRIYLICTQNCERKTGLVEQVSLQILNPPTGQPFGCAQLAFLEINPEIVRSSLSLEVILGGTSGSVPLAGINRLNSKVLLAQGLDREQKTVLVACAELAEITDNHHVHLKAEPVVTLSLSGRAFDGANSMDFGIPTEVRLVVTDSLPQLLSGIDVRWRLLGPGSDDSFYLEKSLGEPQMGQVLIQPEKPSQAGPYLLEIRARWQQNLLLPIKGFVRPLQTSKTLPGSSGSDVVFGRIGPVGEWGLAGLSNTCNSLPERLLCLFSLHYPKSTQASLLNELAVFEENSPTSVPVIGLVQRTDQDAVLIIDQESFKILEPGSSHLKSNPYTKPSENHSGNPLWLRSIGSCNTDTPHDEVLVGFSNEEKEPMEIKRDQVAVYSSHGGSPLEGHAFSFLPLTSSRVMTGCVADQAGIEHQIVIGSTDGISQWDVFVDTDLGVFQWQAWQPLMAMFGFKKSISDQPGLLLMASLTAEVPELSQLRLLLQPYNPNTLDWEVLGSDSLLAVPSTLDTGDLDGDGTMDLVAIIPLLSSSEGILYYAQVILGKETGDNRLSGLLKLGISHESPKLKVADFDGDKIDDLAVVMWQPNDFRREECKKMLLDCLDQCRDDPRCQEECQVSFPCETTTYESDMYLDVYFMGKSST